MAVAVGARPRALFRRASLEVIPMATVRAINPVRGMPFRWSFNPYRGCGHACRYCYARVTHEYLGYNAGPDFERILFAKLDAPDRLAVELSRPSWKRELVAVGTATDPYQPVEGCLQLTRRSLGVFVAFRTPASVVTKSTLVVRDAPLLARLTQAAPGTMVWISVTTLDRVIARELEPRAPPPDRRMEAVRRLAEAGVKVGVLMAPVLPTLTDDEGTLRAVVEAARQAGAADVRANPLRLCPGADGLYAAWLARFARERMAVYRRLYAGRVYPAEGYVRQLLERFRRLKREAGFRADEGDRTAEADGQLPEQLTLPW